MQRQPTILNFAYLVSCGGWGDGLVVGSSRNKAKAAQLELGLWLSLAISEFDSNIAELGIVRI